MYAAIQSDFDSGVFGPSPRVLSSRGYISASGVYARHLRVGCVRPRRLHRRSTSRRRLVIGVDVLHALPPTFRFRFRFSATKQWLPRRHLSEEGLRRSERAKQKTYVRFAPRCDKPRYEDYPRQSPLSTTNTYQGNMNFLPEMLFLGVFVVEALHPPLSFHRLRGIV